MEDAFDGCDTKVRNAVPHKYIRQKELSICFEIGCIILPIRSVSQLNYVQGNDTSPAFPLRPRESLNTSELFVHIHVIVNVITSITVCLIT